MDRFVFWGLFAAYGVLIVSYVIWMRIAERREQHNSAETPVDESR